MFERFTEKAIAVIMLAQDEARRLGHNFVGTEQILLGLIEKKTGTAAKVLRLVGLNLEDTRVEVEKLIGNGSGFVDKDTPFTTRAKKILNFSLEEAKKLNHDYVGTEHLLLGITRENESLAVKIIENSNINLEELRRKIFQCIEIDFAEENLNLIEYYSKLIKQNPEHENAFFNRGKEKNELKDYSGAIADFSKVIELNPENEDAYINRANVKNELKDYSGALEDLSKVIELNPNNRIALREMLKIIKKSKTAINSKKISLGVYIGEQPLS